MVKLTVTGLIKCTSGNVYRRPDETDEDYLMRITHLYLENKQLEYVGTEIQSCQNLVVLYLYDNQLTSIPDLSSCNCLSQLFIQNNNITKIENLESLTTLTKLYIGRNSISFVEGLQNNTNLIELHIEHQKLPKGETLLFDPRSINAISSSLQILNMSGNNLSILEDEINQWPLFASLQQLLLAHNQLCNASALAQAMAQKFGRQLQRLELNGNPLCNNDKKFRDYFIMALPLLETIDGKDVTDTSRQFLINWKNRKDAQDKRKDSRTAKSQYPSGDTGSSKGDFGQNHSTIYSRGVANNYLTQHSSISSTNGHGNEFLLRKTRQPSNSRHASRENIRAKLII